MDSTTLVQSTPEPDVEMRQILEDLLNRDENITARAVARLHPRINAASSITRSAERSQMLVHYQERQAEFRRWRGKAGKLSGAATASALAQRDIRIAELEAQLELLAASHLAMIRAVGEMGGFSKWAQFYESYSASRARLAQLGALPEAGIEPFSLPK